MSEVNQQHLEVPVSGMHCPGCEVFVETQLAKHPGVQSVDADHNKRKTKLVLKPGILFSQVKTQLNVLIAEGNYELGDAKEVRASSFDKPGSGSGLDWSTFATPFAYALVIFFAFVFIQRLNIIPVTIAGDQNLLWVFGMGVIASVSTCMAVVGSLVLSLSATWGAQRWPLLSFHLGRLAGFFILGAALGALGSLFTFSLGIRFVIDIILFTVMVILGLHLLGVERLGPWRLHLSKSWSKSLLSKSSAWGVLTPAALGAITFLLPCGFTQSMQLQALQTGNVFTAAIMMLVFALGTLPVLAGISLFSTQAAKWQQSQKFFYTAGFLVLLFAAWNLWGSLVVLGVLPPLF